MTIKETMSSLQIAEITGKQHQHVMRDIRALLEQGVDASNFGLSSYKNSQNKSQPCFILTKKGCLILASGYSALLREKIINRMEELELALAKPRKFIAPRRRDVQCGQFYDDLTQLVTHEDEREIATRFEVSRSFVHDVLRGQKTGYRVLEALVTRAKENRKAGIERVVPFIASAELYRQLVLDFYTEEA